MRIIEHSNTKKKKLNKEHKILAKNSFYSLLYSYSNFFFSIITSIFIARLISPEVWGFLILAISLIAIFSLILIFLPPGVGPSIIYYLSQFKVLNQNRKVKSLIRNSLLLRVLFIIPVYFLSILIFSVLIDFFALNLKEYVFLFYILSPLIIINALNPILDDIIRAMNMFKIVYFLLVLKNGIYIGGLLWFFLDINPITVEKIAFLLVISSLIPFILNSLIVFYIIQVKTKKTTEEGLSFRECIKKIYYYGTYFSIISMVSSFNKEIKTQLIGTFTPASMVTGYHIGTQYVGVSQAALSPINRPLTISSTRLISKNQITQIPRIFNIIFNYSLFFILLINGFLFYIVDIFLYLVYGGSFLIFSLLIKLLLIANIFTILEPFLGSFLSAANKLKHQVAFISIFGFMKLLFFTIGLILFDIIGAIIFFLISNIITTISFGILFNKFNIKLNVKKPLFIYLIFFISILATIFLELFILRDFYLLILNNLNLLVFQHFNV
ncbi:MAG: oligosaccharide flippase family protein, partial [Promethearchaeota archaeon]